jgi:uncharacterized membrane protein YedE/YeeE
MNHAATAIAAVLFALGLIVGGMTNPDKVIGFLDLFGNWDPSLAFVMGGAVGVNVLTFRYILRRPNPLTSGEFRMPTNKVIDKKLIIGAALFGIGWGIAGFCPGPALVSIGTGTLKVLAFFVMMFVGMMLYDNVINKALK